MIQVGKFLITYSTSLRAYIIAGDNPSDVNWPPREIYSSAYQHNANAISDQTADRIYTLTHMVEVMRDFRDPR